MQKTFIVLLIFITVIVIFAVQNAYLVDIKLWFWNIQSHISITIIAAFLIGALTSFLLSLPGRMKSNKLINEKDDRIKQLESVVDEVAVSENNTKPEQNSDCH